jgi:hypothetical protein
MSFWTKNYKGDGVNNPKRNFRFKVKFMNFDKLTGYDSAELFYAKTADKPSFTLGESTHAFLNHTFKFPGRVTWNDVTITMVDPGPEGESTSTTGVAFALAKLLSQSGYVLPNSSADPYITISKTKAVNGIGDVIVSQLDHDGNEVEKWTLYNAFLSEVNYGSLSYEDDNLTEYKITLKYDWAQFDGVDFKAGEQ